MTLVEIDHMLVKDFDSELPERESEATGLAQNNLVKQNKTIMAKVQISSVDATLRKQIKAKVITKDWPSGKL